MILEKIDWLLIALYFLVSISIDLVMSKRAGKSTGEFFLSGRKLPWYIAGTSMVATTFAAITGGFIYWHLSKIGWEKLGD